MIIATEPTLAEERILADALLLRDPKLITATEEALEDLGRAMPEATSVEVLFAPMSW